MRTTVFFRTRLFENREPKAHFINPNNFGDDLAAWLLSRLQAVAPSFGSVIQEDYGWGFWGESVYWIAIILPDESLGVENPEWLISVAYDPGLNLKRRFFGRENSAVSLQIREALHAALTSEPQITDIRWCDARETDCGGSPT